MRTKSTNTDFLGPVFESSFYNDLINPNPTKANKSNYGLKNCNH